MDIIGELIHVRTGLAKDPRCRSLVYTSYGVQQRDVFKKRLHLLLDALIVVADHLIKKADLSHVLPQ